MAISSEMRRLEAKWKANTGWPKRLDWIEISGLRGWTGQRFNFNFPIMAVVGENGSGKSTVLQCAASVYRSTLKNKFASDFFPDTAWERMTKATIQYALREGNSPIENSIRRPGERWRGNPERRERPVQNVDLSRIQPVSARMGYSKIVKAQSKEVSHTSFDEERLARLSQVMGRKYDKAKISITDAGKNRPVPVISISGRDYSGFHQGAGETTVAELLQTDFPKYSLVLIDEIETSLHPRAQRRLMRDLAEICKERELQIVLTTHSPYILDELPLEGRAQIMIANGKREILYGVSPDFAMTKMDDHVYAECDLYVEDERAGVFLAEILASHSPSLVQRSRIIPYGASSVGQALGQMVAGKRFPRASCVYLDGDQGLSMGCINLPGQDAPERVVWEDLSKNNWLNIHERVGRQFSEVADACTKAMSMTNHHEWVKLAANPLVLSGDNLWQAMCAEWAAKCCTPTQGKKVSQPVEDALIAASSPGAYSIAPTSSGTLPLFPQSPSAASPST